jgi:hypothetical protein
VSEVIQRQGNADWPECWCFYRRGMPAGVDKQAGSTSRVDYGDRTRRQGEYLVYSCTCGSTFKRVEGFHNDEASEWVARHKHHLPEEERA